MWWKRSNLRRNSRVLAVVMADPSSPRNLLISRALDTRILNLARSGRALPLMAATAGNGYTGDQR